MQTVELIGPVRGATCVWDDVKTMVPDLDDSASRRNFFGKMTSINGWREYFIWMLQK
jgi:hypothetical protein